MKTREPAALRRQLAAWIADRVRGAGLNGAVLGLSGGADSAVVCGLAAGALGPERRLALMPPLDSAPDDVLLARRVAALPPIARPV